MPCKSISVGRRGVAIGAAFGLAVLPLFAAPFHWDLPKGFPAPNVPATNPMSEAKVRLGRYLFYDKRMSVNGSQSCASCHKQELAFTDGRATALGATGEAHPRSAMSLVNVAYSAVLTWSNPDQRSLEKQALTPMFGEHPVELGLTGREASVLGALRAEPVYRDLFPQSFPDAKDAFTIQNVTKALAAFERTIISARSPYDRYYTGGDRSAISDAAKRGEVIFFTDPVAGCFRCHSGFNFSDGAYHNTALYQPYAAPNVGIFEFTKRPTDRGKFKAPSLRNIALTAPYMHDGSIRTLEEALDHYAAGGRAHDNPLKDPRMRRIVLTEQNRKDLLEFLQSLTDEELTRDPRFADPWKSATP
jgi:cytochrome c peroxidase